MLIRDYFETMKIHHFIAFFLLIFIHGHLLAEPRNELSFKLKASVVKVHVGTKTGDMELALVLRLAQT